MSSSRAEPLLPAGRFAPHRREQPGAILGTNFANSACAIACSSMVYRWLRIQVPPSALQCIALAMEEGQARTREFAQSVEELQALGEVSHAVNATLDLQTVLSTIVAKAAQLSGTEAGAI